MEALATLVIIGMIAWIGVMALVAWVGERVIGLVEEPEVEARRPLHSAGLLPVSGSGPGKHRPGERRAAA
jgi:hypothetical protein